jgi:hypothetical protein
MFSRDNSSSLKCTPNYKDITYGDGRTTKGLICEDYLKVYNTEDIKANMPFMTVDMPWDVQKSSELLVYDGILGLSPNDESAGPLLIEYLFDQDKI